VRVVTDEGIDGLQPWLEARPIRHRRCILGGDIADYES
jgi:hypothetical protein